MPTARLRSLIKMIKPRFMFYNMPKNIYLIIKFFFLRNKNNIGDQIKEKFKTLFGIDNLILLPQCRVGVYLGVKAIVEPQKNEIILPAYTIYDVVNMVLAGGGRPVFCDVKFRTANIDPEQIEKHITPKTKAVLVPHLHGLSAELGAIRKICDEHDLILIEDVAQALGGTYDGRPLGTIGDVSVFSFGRAKNINAFFGGAISVSNEALRVHIERELAAWPVESSFKLFNRIILTGVSYLATTPLLFNLVTFKYFKRSIKSRGENSLKVLATENNPVRRDEIPESYKRNITKLQEFLVLEQLDSIRSNSDKRKAIANVYKMEINFSSELLPQEVSSKAVHEFFQFPVIVKDRYKIGKYLLENDVDVAFQHLNNLAAVDCFSEFSSDCKETEILSNSLILLPTYPEFGIHNAKKIAKVLNDYTG